MRCVYALRCNELDNKDERFLLRSSSPIALKDSTSIVTGLSGNQKHLERWHAISLATISFHLGDLRRWKPGMQFWKLATLSSNSISPFIGAATPRMYISTLSRNRLDILPPCIVFWYTVQRNGERSVVAEKWLSNVHARIQLFFSTGKVACPDV